MTARPADAPRPSRPRWIAAIAALIVIFAVSAAGWWATQAEPPPDAPPDRDETEEQMREIGYVQCAGRERPDPGAPRSCGSPSRS